MISKPLSWLAALAAASAPAVWAQGTSAAETNPYGLASLWAQGDAVAKITLLILLLMSLASWYVTLLKLQEQRQVGQQLKQVQEGFWQAPSVAEGIKSLSETSSLRFIAQKGLDSAHKHQGMVGQIDFHEWLAMNLQRALSVVQARLQRGLALLATVGSTAPFVGLFGTVWGIYNALVKIGISGQASIDKVAGPVGESLIMTAIGLAVAVPAVLGYNWLVRRNKALSDELQSFASDLHAVLLASPRP
ncbi:MAG: MotA/TolQ/ExbB proton channel family protein [Betaproteobacteria bacterium]